MPGMNPSPGEMPMMNEMMGGGPSAADGAGAAMVQCPKCGAQFDALQQLVGGNDSGGGDAGPVAPSSLPPPAPGGGLRAKMGMNRG